MRHYAHHIGDYAAATRHLTMLEDGAYRRLLDRYYQEERPLPVEVATCCRLVAARAKEERQAVETVLTEFFILEADGWHQKRADREIEAYRRKTDVARENGTKGGRPANPARTNPVSDGVPSEKLTTNHSPRTTPQEPLPSVSDARGRATAPGRASLIADDWMPSEIAIAQLRKGRPDLVGVFFDQRMTDFRLWCRDKAVMSHDPEAAWLGFMRKSRAAVNGDSEDEVAAALERSKLFGQPGYVVGKGIVR